MSGIWTIFVQKCITFDIKLFYAQLLVVHAICVPIFIFILSDERDPSLCTFERFTIYFFSAICAKVKWIFFTCVLEIRNENEKNEEHIHAQIAVLNTTGERTVLCVPPRKNLRRRNNRV